MGRMAYDIARHLHSARDHARNRSAHVGLVRVLGASRAARPVARDRLLRESSARYNESGGPRRGATDCQAAGARPVREPRMTAIINLDTPKFEPGTTAGPRYELEATHGHGSG